MKILGIDPGVSTGWATLDVLDSKMTPSVFGVTKDQTLVEIIEQIRTSDVIVYEGFWIRPDKAEGGKFNWNEMPAPRVIGSLLTLCKLEGKEVVVKQQANQRVPGYAWAGMVYKKGAKGKHSQDALAHAVYYAVTKLRASPVSSKR